ncbi:MAG: hypothetical protein AAF211_05180, partial [Myxococcota bacterium]
MIWVPLLLGCVETEEPRSALEAPEFRFCDIPVPFDDQEAWCRFVADLPPDRCPGVHERCDGARLDAEEVSGCQRDASRPEVEEPYRSRPPVLFEWSSDATEELLRWTGALLVAALVLVLLRAFWLTFGRFRRPEKAAEPEAPAPVETPDDEADAALPDVPALDQGALIERAQ